MAIEEWHNILALFVMDHYEQSAFLSQAKIEGFVKTARIAPENLWFSKALHQVLRETDVKSKLGNLDEGKILLETGDIIDECAYVRKRVTEWLTLSLITGKGCGQRIDYDFFNNSSEADLTQLWPVLTYPRLWLFRSRFLVGGRLKIVLILRRTFWSFSARPTRQPTSEYYRKKTNSPTDIQPRYS